MGEPPVKPDTEPAASAGAGSASVQRPSIYRRIFSLPGLVVSFVGGCALIFGFWTAIRPQVVGPRLELRLTQCSEHMISLRVDNTGGQPAVVSAPVFRRFHDGVLEDLPMEEFVGEVFKDEHSRIAPGGGYVLNYPSRDLLFFRPEWWRGRSCPVQAHMVLDVENGPSRQVEAECPCAQVH